MGGGSDERTRRLFRVGKFFQRQTAKNTGTIRAEPHYDRESRQDSQTRQSVPKCEVNLVFFFLFDGTVTAKGSLIRGCINNIQVGEEPASDERQAGSDDFVQVEQNNIRYDSQGLSNRRNKAIVRKICSK